MYMYKHTESHSYTLYVSNLILNGAGNHRNEPSDFIHADRL